MPMFNDKRTGSTSDLAEGRYAVQKGDSVWSIAEKNKPAGMSTAKYYSQVMAANKGNFKSGDPNKIYSGERLNVPGYKAPESKKSYETTAGRKIANINSSKPSSKAYETSAGRKVANINTTKFEPRQSYETTAGSKVANINASGSTGYKSGIKTKAARDVDAKKARIAQSNIANINASGSTGYKAAPRKSYETSAGSKIANINSSNRTYKPVGNNKVATNAQRGLPFPSDAEVAANSKKSNGR
jgi:hypothetical protein